MLNYGKLRQSADKSSNKSLTRGLPGKSHTSSINIKLTQESLLQKPRSCFKEEAQIKQTQLVPKKYSVKLQSGDKQNQNRTKYMQYDITIVRPFQEINRFMETERPTKDDLKQRERSISKLAGTKLKTDYEEAKMKNELEEGFREKVMKKIERKVRVAVNDMQILIQQLRREESEVGDLRRELDFCRNGAGKGNSVFNALR